MSSASPADVRHFGEDVLCRLAEVVDTVAHGLAVGSGVAVGDGLFNVIPSLLQALFLLVLEANACAESHEVAQLFLDGRPGEFLRRFLVLFAKDPFELVDGLALVFQQVGVQLVGSCSHDESARLVVGRDYDDCLVGVLLVEFVGHLYGLIHIKHFVDSAADVVAVTCPVDHASLDGEEEAVLLFAGEIVDAGAHNLLEREVVLVLVEGIG